MIAIPGVCARSSIMVSKPSFCGMKRSTMTKSAPASRQSRVASDPFWARRTSYPALVSVLPRMSGHPRRHQPPGSAFFGEAAPSASLIFAKTSPRV